MKPGPPKKRKAPTGSESRRGEPSAASERPAGEVPAADNAPAEAPAGRSGSGGTKQSRKDRDRQSRPPVRIVSDPLQEREALSTGKLSSELIAQRAYALFEAAGYEQGREVEHWLEAERQLKAEQRRQNSG